MEFAGPFEGKMILVVIDSHSKWTEAYPTDSSTSTKVIELSHMLFSQFGIPEVLVTDNGPCFVSEEFETFLSKTASSMSPLLHFTRPQTGWLSVPCKL